MKTCSSLGLLHSHSARHITGHGLETKNCPVSIQQNMFPVLSNGGFWIQHTAFQLPISICASHRKINPAWLLRTPILSHVIIPIKQAFKSAPFLPSHTRRYHMASCSFCNSSDPAGHVPGWSGFWVKLENGGISQA